MLAQASIASAYTVIVAISLISGTSVSHLLHHRGQIQPAAIKATWWRLCDAASDLTAICHFHLVAIPPVCNAQIRSWMFFPALTSTQALSELKDAFNLRKLFWNWSQKCKAFDPPSTSECTPLAPKLEGCSRNIVTQRRNFRSMKQTFFHAHVQEVYCWQMLIWG
jgi:hypothetical protein